MATRDRHGQETKGKMCWSKMWAKRVGLLDSRFYAVSIDSPRAFVFTSVRQSRSGPATMPSQPCYSKI